MFWMKEICNSHGYIWGPFGQRTGQRTTQTGAANFHLRFSNATAIGAAIILSLCCRVAQCRTLGLGTEFPGRNFATHLLPAPAVRAPHSVQQHLGAVSSLDLWLTYSLCFLENCYSQWGGKKCGFGKEEPRLLVHDCSRVRSISGIAVPEPSRWHVPLMVAGYTPKCLWKIHFYLLRTFPQRKVRSFLQEIPVLYHKAKYFKILMNSNLSILSFMDYASGIRSHNFTPKHFPLLALSISF